MSGATRVFLGSQGLGALPAWLDELPVRPRRAALVPTAGNRLAATPWVDVARERLAACGILVEDLDLEGASPATVGAVLGRVELVFVTGGDPILLLEHARRSGFATAVRRAVRGGGLAYAGVSAGALLTTPDLALYHGPEELGALDGTDGLGLIRFFPLVHANRGRRERYARLMAGQGDRHELVPLNDDEALVVTGSAWQRRNSPIA